MPSWEATIRKIRDTLYRHVRWLEVAIGALLTLALLIVAVRMIIEAGGQIWTGPADETFNILLNNAFTLVIGVEFIKMILRPTTENMLEVIALTIARFVVMDHTSMGRILLGVLALGGLFAIKKFMFCEIAAPTRIPPNTVPQPEAGAEKETDDETEKEDLYIS